MSRCCIGWGVVRESEVRAPRCSFGWCLWLVVVLGKVGFGGRVGLGCGAMWLFCQLWCWLVLGGDCGCVVVFCGNGGGFNMLVVLLVFVRLCCLFVVGLGLVFWGLLLLGVYVFR